MTRLQFAIPALFLLTNLAWSQERAPSKTHLPKPLEDIACKLAVLEQGGHFTLIDVRYEEVGENACNRGPGLVWTLKANKPIRTNQASEFLKKFRNVRFYKKVKGADVQVGTNLIFAPNKIDLGFLFNEVLQPGEAIEIYMFLNEKQIDELRGKKAVTMVMGR